MKRPLFQRNIFSALKSNEQLLTGNQCNRYDYIDIKYFIGPNFERKRYRHKVCERCVLSITSFPPPPHSAAAGRGNRTHCPEGVSSSFPNDKKYQ